MPLNPNISGGQPLMTTKAAEQPQTHMDEINLDGDEELLGILTDFAKTKKANTDAASKHKANKTRLNTYLREKGHVKDDKTKVLIRCGVWQVKGIVTNETDVSFIRSAGFRLSPTRAKASANGSS